MSNKLPYVYVVATSYSGSTLMSLLLDSHPQIASIGEVDNSVGEAMRAGRHEQFPCSCGETLLECEFWLEVQKYCRSHGVELDLHDFRTRLGQSIPLRYRRLLFGSPSGQFWLKELRDRGLRAVPAYRRHVEQTLHRGDTIARGVLEITGKPIFVDASKGASRAFELVDRPGLDLHVIHLVRDVRGFVASSLDREPDCAAATAANVWHRAHTLARRLQARLPANRFLTARWEDFCREPQATLDVLCKFMGVDGYDMVATVNSKPHHVLGNRIRLKPVQEIRYRESWKERLSPEQLEACSRVAGESMRAFGYA